MAIQNDGTPITIQLKSLGDKIDNYLKELFTLFLQNFNQPFEEVFHQCYQDLKSNLFEYFDRKKDNQPGQDYIFNNLSILWKFYQINGRVGEAQQFWNDILKIVLEWEHTQHSRIHKGSIYYFWSQTAILQGELDKGFFLIHSAYEEDVLTCGTEYPDTPTVKTITLNYLDERNLLYNHVLSWSSYLDELINTYKKVTGSKFTKDDFRSKFLSNPPSRDVLFSFTYNLAKFFYFDQMPHYIIKGKFPSLYELDLLFNLVLVTDAVIYKTINNPGPNDWTFSNLAKHLFIESNLSADAKRNDNHLKFISQQQKIDFVRTITTLLDNKMVYLDGDTPSIQERDLLITYCLRNYSAHNVNSFPVIHDRYNELRQCVFNSIFYAIESIY